MDAKDKRIAELEAEQWHSFMREALLREALERALKNEAAANKGANKTIVNQNSRKAFALNWWKDNRALYSKDTVALQALNNLLAYDDASISLSTLKSYLKQPKTKSPIKGKLSTDAAIKLPEIYK